MQRSKKCVVVGDGAVGKTSLCISYTTGKCPKEHVPTVFDNKTTTVDIDGETIKLSLWDTAGQEDYDRLRPLSYPLTNVFLVCYSVMRRTSYENVSFKWVPEITHHAPEAPFVLVGTKIDLRNNREEIKNLQVIPLQTEDGETLAKKIGAAAFVECSSLTQDGLKNVFDVAVRLAIKSDNKEKPQSSTNSSDNKPEPQSNINDCQVM